MFRNYIKTAVRNLRKQKVFSFINIMGLAVGLSCCILLYLYLVDELSYDNFHSQERSVFRILTNFHEKDGSIRSRGPSVPVAVAPLFKKYFPEIKHVIRFARERGTVRKGNILGNETITFTDPPVFKVFSFPLLGGNPETVLSNDYSLVLTERMAEKYFGDQDPVGQSVTLTFSDKSKDFTVTGVVRDVPSNSTIKFDILAHINNLPLASYEKVLTALMDFAFPLFVQLDEGIKPARIEGRMEAFMSQTYASHFQKWRNDSSTKGINPISFELQRLRDMHFDKRSYDGTDPANALILGGIALIILFIACINFVNLSIGRAAIRSMEIGMRKVIGASKRQLIFQFWSESLVLVFLALLLGLILVILFMPTFSQLSAKELSITEFSKMSNIIALGLLLLIVAIASGSYPALVMSRAQPVQIFRNKLGIGGRRTLAKVLVVVQFTLSVFLIISSMILGKQIRFITEKDPGYVKEGLVSIRLQINDTEGAQKLVNLFREKARSYPDILNVSAASVSFGRGSSRFPLEKDGQRTNVYQFRVDQNYVPTVGLKLVQGRNFEKGRKTDSDAVIVNQEFCRKLGITDPIDRRIGELFKSPINDYPYKLQIIGVVEDYNVLSFKQSLKPTIVHMQPGWGMRNMIVRISNTQIARTLGILDKTWKEIQPDKPFVFTFVEDDLESQYNKEKKWNGIVRYSSLFAVIIACMGIFGLTSLSVNRRFKEIGIRKVLGANLGQIFSLVTREFLLLVAIANVVAWPISYYIMKSVLIGYFYRIKIGLQFFFLAGILSLMIALITISYLAVKAALSDPVKAIRHE